MNPADSVYNAGQRHAAPLEGATALAEAQADQPHALSPKCFTEFLYGMGGRGLLGFWFRWS